MPELVNFGHNQLLEAMLTLSTWKGGFSSADKQAMKDALKTIDAKCITDVEYDRAVATVLGTAMCLWLSGKLDEIKTEED